MQVREMFYRHLAQTSDAPLALEIVSAEGCRLRLNDGRELLDMISGISVSNTGHGHPAVIRAVETQMKQYMHLMVYGELIHAPQVKMAKALTDLLPASLDNVYFTNSGAEATEGAMKLAKRVTGRSNFVAFRNSYHGSTQGALSLMGSDYFTSAFRPLLPGVTHLPYGTSELEAIDEQTAAVFVEPVQAESGVTVPSDDFLLNLEKRCRATGALLVFDEIQTGMGRTGKWFAFEHSGVVPDILLLAKALGGGMPLGAFISNREKMQLLTRQPVLGHITTFGGHPVSTAAGLAALQVIQEENLIEQVEEKGKLLESLLVHPCILSVRRKGLLMGLEFRDFEFNKSVIDEAIRQGVFTDWFLFASHCLRLAPPLTISHKEIREAADKLLKAISRCASA